MTRILILALFLLFIGATVQAQPYINTVWEQIQEAYDENVEMDYTMKNYIIGKIGDSDENTWTFYLNSGTEYLIEGFCDEDCEDLDLSIMDENGTELDSDVEEDNYPIIFFDPSTSGRYSIKVSMYSCNVEPCYFGMTIFEK